MSDDDLVEVRYIGGPIDGEVKFMDEPPPYIFCHGGEPATSWDDNFATESEIVALRSGLTIGIYEFVSDVRHAGTDDEKDDVRYEFHRADLKNAQCCWHQLARYVELKNQEKALGRSFSWEELFDKMTPKDMEMLPVWPEDVTEGQL